MKRITEYEKTVFRMFFGILACLILVPTALYMDYKSKPDNSKVSSSEFSSEPSATTTNTPTPIPTVEVSSYVDIDLLDLPKGSDGHFKSWEDKESINDKTSAQYALIQKAEANQYGFMCYDGYYLVALGTYYAHNIGDKFVVCFENGVSIPVMIGDVKADEDTVDGMYCIHNGSIIEFIIDKSVMKKEYWIQGDLSCLGFEGKITMIRRVG